MVANRRALRRVESIERQQEELSVIWAQVIEHLGRIQRTVRKMARVDSRLCEEDLLQDALLDIKESARYWRPSDGSWMSWARTRIWKCRTVQLRVLNRDEPRDRVTMGTSSTGADLEDGDRTLDLPAGAGVRGTAGRMEALAELQRIYDRSSPCVRECLLAELHGFNTKSLVGVNRAESGRKLRRSV